MRLLFPAERLALRAASSEGDYCVEAAEGERVGESGFGLGLAGGVGDAVEIAVGVGTNVVGGGGQDAVVEG